MYDRIRIIRLDGSVCVRDYAFSQVCEMLAGLSRENYKVFMEGNEVVIPSDTIFARVGEKAKLVNL